jgi:hypothetical protein
VERRSWVIGALVLLAVLFPVNAGAIQLAGASGTAWWIIGWVVFAVPSTIVIVALAHADGSPFVSMQGGGHLAHAGALGIWIGGSLAALSAAVAAVTFGARALGAEPSTSIVGVLALALAILGILSGGRSWWGLALLGGASALILVIGLAVAVGLSQPAAAGSAAAQGGWLSLSGGLSWIGLVVLGLVGAHEPYQRARLRPVAARPVWVAMVLVLVGYVALTLALDRALPVDASSGFTSLADLGGLWGSGWSRTMSVLVCLAFVATVIGMGAVFRELQGDLRLPWGSMVVLIATAAVVCFIAVPLWRQDDGADSAASAYAITQGATALLWALGYVAMGGLAMRVVHSAAVRTAGAVTVVLGLVGTASVLTGPFTPLLSTRAWVLGVVVMSIVAVAVAWVLKAEHDHHSAPDSADA